MIKKLQRKFALSEKGAKDLVKGCIACAFQNISFMFPVWILYMLVSDLMAGGLSEGRSVVYVIGCIMCVLLFIVNPFF